MTKRSKIKINARRKEQSAERKVKRVQRRLSQALMEAQIASLEARIALLEEEGQVPSAKRKVQSEVQSSKWHAEDTERLSTVANDRDSRQKSFPTKAPMPRAQQRMPRAQQPMPLAQQQRHEGIAPRCPPCLRGKTTTK